MRTIKDVLDNGLKRNEVLALDISTKCGYFTSGLSGQKCFNDSNHQIRLQKYADWLSDLILRNGIKIVCIEDYVLRYKQSTAVLLELQGITKLICADLDIPVITFPVATIKYFATHNGKATKEDMIKAISKRFHIDCETDDEADAAAIYYLFISRYEITT